MRGGTRAAAIGVGLCLVLCLGGTVFAKGGPILFSPEAGEDAKPTNTLSATVSLPGNFTAYLHAPERRWVNYQALEFDVFWPAEAPTNTQLLVFIKDWDYYWYQNLPEGYLDAGQTNHFRIDLSPGCPDWEPRGHRGTWHLRALMEPKEFGLRVFSTSDWSGACTFVRATAIARQDHTPPTIRNVRARTNHVPQYGVFELTFALPDRYPNPFLSDEVRVTAEFKGPSGRPVSIDGFYGRDYYRLTGATEEQLLPQGPPYWRVRFSPLEEGLYTYTLHVKDRNGEGSWGPGTFRAAPAAAPGFIRVSRRDPRFFEFSNDTPFFPIGHNIRSPFDTRMDRQYPWRQRWQEGTTLYRYYFEKMGQNGENIAELWTAAWSLGLEWSSKWRGFHGIGQYNMMNAWELDRVIEAAIENDIYINLVIHNHGKFSAYSDHEWTYNPFALPNGGYLEKPEEYFTDPRALKSFRELMRYMVARWSCSTRIFAWELWSELDLTGSSRSDPKNYRRPEVVDWHRLMGRAIKDMDPYNHPISTHVCGDYGHQNEAIISLPEIDLCPVDAYHNSGDPLHIVDLMRRTARHNNPFNKPVLITEFGGSSRGQGVRHISDTLHAALWGSTCIPVSGTPFLWWWQLIDEENFYPMYKAVSEFMKDVDRRDPDLVMTTPHLTADASVHDALRVDCLASPRLALGWLYRVTDFETVDPKGPPTVTDASLALGNMREAAYTVEFYDTLSGRRIHTQPLEPKDRTLTLTIPPFARDIAFKVRAKTVDSSIR